MDFLKGIVGQFVNRYVVIDEGDGTPTEVTPESPTLIIDIEGPPDSPPSPTPPNGQLAMMAVLFKAHIEGVVSTTSETGLADAGFCFGLSFGDSLPVSTEDDGQFDNLLGIHTQKSSSDYDEARVTIGGGDFADISGDASSSTAYNFHFGCGNSTSNSSVGYIENGMRLPKDSTQGEVYCHIWGIVESAGTLTDPSFFAWANDDSLDLSSSNLQSVSPDNLDSTFPKAASSFFSANLVGSTPPFDNYKPDPGNGVLQVPDKFVVKYPLSTGKIVITHLEYAYYSGVDSNDL